MSLPDAVGHNSCIANMTIILKRPGEKNKVHRQKSQYFFIRKMGVLVPGLSWYEIDCSCEIVKQKGHETK